MLDSSKCEQKNDWIGGSCSTYGGEVGNECKNSVGQAKDRNPYA